MDVKVTDTFLESFKRCFRPWWHPAELWYWFKCWAWKRHSTVRPRYLPHTWCDRCDLLPHAMFEILSQFVERECSPGCIEWYGDDGRTIERNGVDVFVRDEMQAIYDWWNITYNKEYPERLSEIEERLDAFMPDSEFQETESPHLLEWNPSWNSSEVQESYESSLKEMQALNSRADRERIEFMHRLVEISPYMWT